MWLTEGINSALVSPQGGSVHGWFLDDHAIWGPSIMTKTGNQLKRRKESHWCFPQFGEAPEGQYFQPHHGYLRNADLLTHSRAKSFVFFTTEKKEGVGIITHVEAFSMKLSVTLQAVNRGTERVPVLPAFHPYFNVPKRGLTVSIGGETVIKAGSALVPLAHKVSNRGTSIQLNGRSVVVLLHGLGQVALNPSENCTHVMLWSDQPNDYVCVEPVFGTPGTYATDKGQWLNPGQEVLYFCIFTFTPE